MARIVQDTGYSPTARDIQDFLKGTNISQSNIKTFLRKRGIYVSKELIKDNNKLADFVSKFHWGWDSLEELYNLTKLRDKEKLKNAFSVEGKIGLGEIEGMIIELGNKTEFNLRRDTEESRENIQRWKTTIKTKQPKFNRLLQSSEQDVEISIKWSSKSITVYYDDFPEIIPLIRKLNAGLIKIVQENKTFSQTIHIIDSETLTGRVNDFFGYIWREMKGCDSGKLTVYSLSFIPCDSNKEEHVVEERVSISNANFKGENIYESDQVKDLIRKNYEIKQAVWEVIDKDTKNKIKLKGCFEKRADPFKYNILNIQNEKGEEIVIKGDIEVEFLERLRDAAIESYRKIKLVKKI